ncbi:MAG: AtpZ/AtpI family protein [Actinomycetota bacterium]|nr:AtpZ/AtpI family protein [Actinomycetota bacterium]
MSSTGSGSGGKADFARGFSLAFEFVGAVFLFWFVGRLVDNWLGTEPWIQVAGALVGWGGGFLHVYYRTRGEGWQDLKSGTDGTSGDARRGDKGGDGLGGRR